MIGRRVKWGKVDQHTGRPTIDLVGTVEAIALTRDNEWMVLVRKDDGTFHPHAATDLVSDDPRNEVGTLKMIDAYLSANALVEPGDGDAYGTIKRVFDGAVKDIQMLEETIASLKKAKKT